MPAKKKQTKNNSSNKDDRLVIRLDTELKQKITDIAIAKGTNASEYVRQLILKDIGRYETISSDLMTREELENYISIVVHAITEAEKQKNKIINEIPRE